MGKKKNKIPGPFAGLTYRLLDSDAFISLSNGAQVAYIYFMRDKKNYIQKEVSLTFKQAKKAGVCKSPSSFVSYKRELIERGLLDNCEPGGLNQRAIYIISERWKEFGTCRFVEQEFNPGIGSKFFRTAMKNKSLREKLICQRHHKILNTVSV